MLDALLGNHLLLAAVILVLLLLVPAWVASGRRPRRLSQPDRRKRPRDGVDRRA